MASNKVTLFVADLPVCTTEQDIVGLFSSHPGYIAARLRNDRNGDAVAFVEFQDGASAATAQATLQGHSLASDHTGIAIEFAKNSQGRRRNRDNGGGGGGGGSGGRRAPSSSHHSSAPAMVPDQFTYSSFGQMGAYPQNSVLPQLPEEASCTLYLEGLPLDATEREVGHIFRPFPGYQSVRIMKKEAKQSGRPYLLCFVEFDNRYQATVGMHALRGYRMEKNDTRGLTIHYAKTERNAQRKRAGSNTSDSSTVSGGAAGGDDEHNDDNDKAAEQESSTENGVAAADGEN